MKTVYDASGRKVEYESGPWRIPETHKRAVSAFAEHGVALVPLSTTSPHSVASSTPESAKTDTYERKRAMAGLTTWGVTAMAQGPVEADRVDRDTGYSDQTLSSSGSEPYSSHAAGHFVAPSGFTSLVTRMEGRLRARPRYEHRVTDVRRYDDEERWSSEWERGRYVVTVVSRTGHNSFRTSEVRVDALFVCVPPHVFSEWDVFRRWGKSLSCSVEAGPLHHVYVNDRDAPRNKHRVDGKSLVAQSLSSQYEGSSWFQASYSGGRVARFWNHLKLSSPYTFVDLLRRECGRLLGHVFRRDAEVRSHYWPYAFHVWRAVPNFDLERSVRVSLRPSPSLPLLYVCGEAFSSFQAWIEGALQTADMATALFQSDAKAFLRRSGDDMDSLWGTNTSDADKNRSDVVYVEGHPISVSEWSQVHPGGALALKNHMGEDVTSIFRHVGHSHHAWSIVHSLKIEVY